MAKIVHVKSARVRKDKDGNVKPNHTCQKCKVEIKVGDPYKHVSVKTGPRSSRTQVRCDTCPNWHSWELSNALYARVEQVQHNYAEGMSDNFGELDDVKAVLEEASAAVQEIAEEKRESAQNIEDGFGHSTSQSEELEEQADSLEAWADEIAGAADSIEELDEYRENHPDDFEDPEDKDEVLEVWREYVRDEITIVDESPV